MYTTKPRSEFRLEYPQQKTSKVAAAVPENIANNGKQNRAILHGVGVWRDGKLYSSSLVSSSGAPRRSDLRWESFNAGTICSLSIDDLFNNLFSNVFNNLFQNSQSVEILKQSRYVGADGKKDKFFLHSHDYHMATGLPENSHILELSNRLLNTLLNRY